MLNRSLNRFLALHRNPIENVEESFPLRPAAAYNGQVMQRSKKSAHTQRGKLFLPPMTKLAGIQLVPWDKGLLPEFLWIESLISMYGRREGATYYKMLLEQFDKYPKLDHEHTHFGTVTDFGNYSPSVKHRILTENQWFIRKCIIVPFAHILRLYPKSPMGWLRKGHEQYIKETDRDDSIDETSNSVMRLFMAKDDYAGHVRALPLSRLFEHQKIHLVRNESTEELIQALLKYPTGTSEENSHVESFARTTVNMDIMEREEKKPKPWKWSSYFWSVNSTIVRCHDEWKAETIRIVGDPNKE
jgi:hypothetical protein